MATKTNRDRVEVDLDCLHRGVARLPEALAMMKFESLREGQDSIIYNVLGSRDTIGFLPTAQGKSATFIIPAFCLGWSVMVFSPLVALMQDQVQSIWRKGLTAGQLSGLQSDAENNVTLQRWVRGEIQFLYLAPERIKNQEFMAAIAQRKPDMIVVDEAHSIAQWGTNFRPQYAKIGGIIKTIDPKVVLAITATATADVEDEIRSVLHIEHAYKISYLPERKNLKMSSSPYRSESDLVDMIKKINGPTIVYCATTKGVEELGASLDRHRPGRVTVFHGGLGKGTKKTNQQMFMDGEVDVCVATNAFGMGIDKSNIRGVIHYDHPGSIDALAQEMGRAGRDGFESICHVFERKESYNTQKFFVDNGHPDERTIRSLFKVIQDEAKLLNQDYVEFTMRDLSFKIDLGSFGEMKVGAAISIMIRNGVLDRPKSDDKICQIRFKSGAQSDDRMSKYWDIVERLGEKNDNNFFEIDLNFLVTKIGVSEATVRKHLKDAQTEGLVDFLPPFRGTPTYIKGDVNVINFQALKVRYKESLAKIDDVIKYIRTPDNLKSQFIKAYFEK